MWGKAKRITMASEHHQNPLRTLMKYPMRDSNRPAKKG